MSHDVAAKGIEYTLLSDYAFHRTNASISDLSLQALPCGNFMQTVQYICVTKKSAGMNLKNS